MMKNALSHDIIIVRIYEKQTEYQTNFDSTLTTYLTAIKRTGITDKQYTGYDT